MAYENESEEVQLSEDQRGRLLQYLCYEIDTAISERQTFEDNLIAEAEAYRAEPAPDKNTPWPGACRVTIPVIASSCGSVFPRLHSTLNGVSNIITVEEWPEELADHAKAWEDFLQWSFENEIDFGSVSSSWLQEAVVHGTSIMKVVWDRIERETMTYDDEGEIVSRQLEVIRNRPSLKHVTLSDFFIRFPPRSIEQAEWCAERMRMLEGDLRLYESNGLFSDVDKIIASTEIESPEYQRALEEIEGTNPIDTTDYEIFEFWCNFDLEGDGVQVPLKIYFHRKTQTLLSVRLNPYQHGKKPFIHYIFEPFPNRFFGLGLAGALMSLQDEITTLHRQRIDNNTIANSKMWKVVAGSRADQSFHHAGPGLKILVDALDEIDSLEVGSTGMAESMENERIDLQYAQQRAGLHDFSGGMDIGQASGRQTATQTVALMHERRTRFNWTLDRAREAVRQLGVMMTDLYAQYFNEEEVNSRFEEALGPTKAALITEMFSNFGVGAIGNALALQVTASSASVNKVIEGQNLMGLVSLVQNQVVNFEMPLVQLLLNPNTPENIKEYALERINGSRALMRRVLEVSDVRNTDEVLGSTNGLTGAPTPPPPPLAPVGGGPGQPAPNGAVEGMGGLGGLMGGPTGGQPL